MSLDAQIAEIVRAEVGQHVAKLLDQLNPSGATRVVPRYLTVPQAGEYIGKTAGAIYQMIHKKEIPAIHAGHRTVRIDRNDLDTWAARRRY